MGRLAITPRGNHHFCHGQNLEGDDRDERRAAEQALLRRRPFATPHQGAHDDKPEEYPCSQPEHAGFGEDVQQGVVRVPSGRCRNPGCGCPGSWYATSSNVRRRCLRSDAPGTSATLPPRRAGAD
jgi:hypothetical protein